MSLSNKVRSARTLVDRFGWEKTAAIALDRAVNALLFADCFHVVVLDRDRLEPVPDLGAEKISFRFADLSDLHVLSRRPELDVRADKIQYFLEGDVCLLTFVGGKLAGYTWAHAAGAPLLIPGLRLKIPPGYLYNYASLTLPEFRGRNLQARRHLALLESPEFRSYAGLVGYVRATNWSSRAGLKKSGYRDIGRIWMVGTGDQLAVRFEDSVRSWGIERLPTDRVAPIETPELSPVASVAALTLGNAAAVVDPTRVAQTPPAAPPAAAPQAAGATASSAPAAAHPPDRG